MRRFREDYGSALHASRGADDQENIICATSDTQRTVCRVSSITQGSSARQRPPKIDPRLLCSHQRKSVENWEIGRHFCGYLSLVLGCFRLFFWLFLGQQVISCEHTDTPPARSRLTRVERGLFSATCGGWGVPSHYSLQRHSRIFRAYS